MGDRQQRGAVRLDAAKQQLQNVCLVARIQVTRRLVGQHQPGLADDGAGHGHTLLLATGQEGGSVGINTFGESAPGGVLMKHFGFTVENVVNTVKSVL